MRRSAILGLAAAAVLAAVLSAVGGASVALADALPGLRWQLGFKNETPTWVRIPGAGDKTTIAWYMSYTVENKTGAARKPAIRAELRTDTGKTFIDGGDPLVIAAVKKALDVKEISTASDLHKGIADGAKASCVATFGDVDKYAKKIELRVYGLMDPVTMVKGKEVFEVKYWSVKYERKGDEFGRTEDKWKAMSTGWVTEEPKKQ
jgi:hypothetical protein